MILRRLGNKRKLLQKIIPYYPSHQLYIELFFGAGGAFFEKPRSRYNIVNDVDSDVFNLFQVVSTRLEEFRTYLKTMPVHEDLWAYWRENQETDPIRKAARFIFQSNWGYLGKPETLRYLNRSTHQMILDQLEPTQERLFGVEFMNCDFRQALGRISVQGSLKDKTFIYADPPYLDTENNYSEGFTEEDSRDLFNILERSGYKWAMSEFDHPFVLRQARERGLYVHRIGERRNIKNRRVEVLLTNYPPSYAPLSLF